MEIATRPIAELAPYASNSRTHSDAQVAQIAASIKEFGFTNPILTDGEKGIIAGHGRLMAARKLGLETVPTIELAYLTEAQRRAYIIADNKLALNAGWDMDLLAVEMNGLNDEGFDLSLIGFGDDELAAILADKTEGLTDPDDVPELPDDPATVEGDVWLLGNHRLMCGDSTVATDVETLLNGVSPHLMVTDPPYGVEYDADWRNHAMRANGAAVGGRAIGKPGQAVYEPFSGSGTTIIAGEMTARSIYGMELSPAYVDVAVKRWQDFTGEQAILEGSGETFCGVIENAA